MMSIHVVIIPGPWTGCPLPGSAGATVRGLTGLTGPLSATMPSRRWSSTMSAAQGSRKPSEDKIRGAHHHTLGIICGIR